MKIKLSIMLCAVALIINDGLAQDGSLDPTFGDQGNALLFLGNEVTLHAHFIDQGISGRIVTCGIESVGVITVENGYVRAFLENGNLDTSFGNNGQVFIDLNIEGPIDEVHVLDDDSILFSTYAGAKLTKLLPDGSVDTSFGNNGALLLDNQDVSGLGHKLHPDGSIFFIGISIQSPRMFVIRKYNPDGVLDTNFGSQGTASFSIDQLIHISAYSLLIKHNNTLFVNFSSRPSASDPYSAYMYKLSPNGVLDTNYGDNGKLTLNINNAEHAKFFLHQNDHLLVSYYYYDTQLMTYVRKIIRLTQNGDIDSSFADNGVLNGNSVEIVEQNQRIITNASFSDFEGGIIPHFNRYFPNGDVDTSFNFQYTYSEISSISTATSPNGDFLLSGADIWYNGPESYLLIAKYKSTPLGYEDIIIEQLEIYPNPVQDILHIENNGNLIISSIKFYDVLGRLVLKIDDGNTDRIDLSGVNGGILYLNLETDRGILTKMIVLE
ncbi:MAG: T9SS C-terminal target domain-containing protein [Flavobacterium sp.]|nr:MAG: T9SS C-terminal target domain-containing protein [Flavobacterium sp.]